MAGIYSYEAFSHRRTVMARSASPLLDLSIRFITDSYHSISSTYLGLASMGMK